MKSYNKSNSFSGSTGHNGKGRLSYWKEIPDQDFLEQIYQDTVPLPDVEDYVTALKQYSRDCPDGPGEKYFIAVDHITRLELYLKHFVKFDEPETLSTTDESAAQTTKSYEKKPTLTQKQLVAEIEQLIDGNSTEAKLSEVLPFLARLANITSRDVQTLYTAKLAEIEMSQSSEELKQDLDQLLAIGSESLNLFEFLPPALAEPMLRIGDRLAMRPETLLLTLLTAISSLHKPGTDLIISAEGKFFVYPNLNSGIIAESGRKKSPIMRIFVKYPFLELEKEANEQLRFIHEQQVEEYQQCPESERKEQFPDGEPKAPPAADYYFTDGTVEGVNRQFSRFPNRGMLYLRDELSGVFAFDKYRGGKGSERQDFLSFYDGFGKKELRAEGFASRADQVLLSIFGTIQPDILRQLMEDPLAADGQWARFLFVIQPPRPAKLKKGGSYDINKELLNPLYKRIDSLPVMHYQLTEEAFDYYQQHYDQLEIKACTDPDPAMRAVFSKMEGAIGKLAINLHVLHELIGQKSTTRVSEYIPITRIAQACKLAKFFINQIRLINTTVMKNTAEEQLAPNLAAIVERSRCVGAVSARDINRAIWALHNSSAGEIRNHFRKLAELGYGTCEGSGCKMKFTAIQLTQR